MNFSMKEIGEWHNSQVGRVCFNDLSVKVRNLVDMFREYYVNILQAEIDARKTEKGKAGQQAKLNKILIFFSQKNKNNLKKSAI